MEWKEWLFEAKEKSGMTLDQMGAVIGRTKQNVGHMLKGRQMPSISQVLAISKATDYPLPLELMSQVPDLPAEIETLSRGVAHDLSLQRPIVTLPKLAWGDLDMGKKPDEQFELEVIDGAFGADIPPGCIMRMDPDRAPRAGWPLLVKDRHGKHYLRDYQQAAGDRWQAVARTRGFAPMDSEDDGLEIIAVMKGVDWL